MEYLCSKFSEHHYPGRQISVDETIIPYGGANTPFIVFIENKPVNRGFLLFDIADPRNGYLLNAELYTGKEKRNSTRAIIERTFRLLSKYLDKGHIVYADNFYTSIDLLKIEQEI